MKPEIIEEYEFENKIYYRYNARFKMCDDILDVTVHFDEFGNRFETKQSALANRGQVLKEYYENYEKMGFLEVLKFVYGKLN